MKQTIRINLRQQNDDSYDIELGSRLDVAARSIRDEYPRSLKFVITDSNVRRLYGKRFIRAIFRPEVATYTIVIPAGEQSKNRQTKEEVEDQLLARGADRNSLIIALGGGVVGDIAGFVAATTFRGVSYIQIPTTLLAQVDSSIGGKVAVDHPLGKNLIGAFYQPKKVYIDVGVLKTLPAREFRNGLAEVVKYAAILDQDLFRFLEKNKSRILQKDRSTLTQIVTWCCELKKLVVQRDERESDFRRILNFGHTIGHALELQSNYRIPHGEAVAIGMCVEARISAAREMLDETGVRRLASLLSAFRLPTDPPKGMKIERILESTAHDKKAREGAVHYTLLERIGRARVGVALTSTDVQNLLG